MSLKLLLRPVALEAILLENSVNLLVKKLNLGRV